MNSIIPILLFIGLPYMICGREVEFFVNEVEKLNELARNKVSINGVLELNEDGFLSESYVGFMYQGMKGDREVTIKFVPNIKKTESEREFEMFKYLDAYNNPKVERFGIPAIYYHDQWNNYTVTAFTRVYTNMWVLGDEGWFSAGPLNAMLLFKRFVIQSKYMHSRGVRHDHISQFNVMSDYNQLYLMDFDFSAKLTDDKVSCYNNNIGKMTQGKRPMFAMDDWTNFLRAMLKTLEIPADIPQSSCCGVIHIDETAIDGETLQKVIKRFADEISSASCSKVFPDYDDVEQFISAQIKKEKGNDLAVFSWLLSERKRNAIEAIQKNPLNIKAEITDPKSIDFKKFAYKK